MLHTHDIYEHRARLERHKELSALTRALTRSLAIFLFRRAPAERVSRTERNSTLVNDNARAGKTERAA